jgi:hypothetical protein
MREPQSEQRETGDESSVDLLLNLLGELSQRDPSPVLRERLAAAAAQRLRDGERICGAGRRRSAWLKAAVAVLMLAGIGLTAALVFRFRLNEHAQHDRIATVSEPAISRGISREGVAHIAPAAPAVVSRRPRIQRPHAALAQTASARRMTMQLPYSNRAIETGTYSTIRVSMSQSELLSLGFPINATVQERRIAAELTLGDDGLPRAISLPLPLEVLKEKR